MIFKTFVVNLKRCPEKREKMVKRLEGEEYEMITAVDGKELNKDILKELDVEILKQWKDPWSGRNITWGEVGCTLSHYNIYKYCVENNIENAVILEDDVNIPQNLSSILDNIIGNLNKEISSWELCYLSRKPMNSVKENINEFKDFVKAEYSYWTCSYIINLKGMKKIIDSNYHKNIIPADEILPILGKVSPHKEYYKYYNIKDPLNMYSLKQMICNPEEEAFKKSDTENAKEIDACDNELLLLATGTDMTDGLKRFIKSCKTYGLQYKIMGLNTQWNGGNMSNGPGGGQKINLLLETLNDLNDNQIVLVTDSYDVIMSANSKEIIKKYKKFNNNIVFATESCCWPDKHKSNLFPKIKNRKNLYLNSGGFIGDVKSIKQLIDSVPNHSDDQRFYIDIFLGLKHKKSNNLNGISGPGAHLKSNLNSNIVLDYNCEIFQCLNDAETDLFIDFSKSRIFNKITKTYPCQIHGNGAQSRKNFLNSYENYLIKNWSESYGYNKKNIIDITDLNKNLTIYIHQIDNCIKDHTIKMNNYINENINEVKKYLPNAQFIYANETMDHNDALKDALKYNPDYYWLVDYNFVITHKETLLTLLKQDKGIISPLLTKPGKIWSNFWGKVCNNGWYKTSFDYVDIVECRKKGCWNVPHISGNILIKKGYLNMVQNFYNNTSGNTHFSNSMNFSYNCRKNNIFMYVVNNDNKFGYICEEIKDDIPDNVKHKSLYMFETNTNEWAKKYLHTDFYNAINDWNKLPVEEPCKFAFEFPFVNDLFCEHILDEVNKEEWSIGGTNHKTKDNRINNIENVPTQDIHMKQIGFRNQWEAIIHKYLAPLVSFLYSPFKTHGLNIAFVVKYEMGHQTDLMPHHDSATYSTVITLNKPGIDFTGGGTRFVKQDVICKGKKGWCTLHPGKLTHYHEGLPITSGKRFIFVSFIN